MVLIRGIGMYMKMDFTLMHSPLSLILYGGIGNTIPSAGAEAGDGHHTVGAGEVLVIGVAGMAAGVPDGAAAGVLVGDHHGVAQAGDLHGAVLYGAAVEIGV